MGTLDARLELRVDTRTIQRLEQRAAARHTTVAQIVRECIHNLLDEEEHDWRVAAVARAVEIQTPVPSDPDELARLLDETYGGD